MARYGEFEIGFDLRDIEDQFEIEDVQQLMKRFNLVGEDDMEFRQKYEQLVEKLYSLHRSHICDTPEFFKRNLDELFGEVLNVSTY